MVNRLQSALVDRTPNTASFVWRLDAWEAKLKRLLLAVAFGLASCATQYGQMGFEGGVDAQMIAHDLARISARGNELSDHARITDFVLLKSAETAKEHGFSHFAIVEGWDASSTVVSSIGGSVSSHRNPGRDVVVKFCKGACAGMTLANEVIANLGPRYYEKQG